MREIGDVRALVALAHADRARLMDALAMHGPSTTTTLARTLGLATGSVSHHLKVLSDAGLVARRAGGGGRSARAPLEAGHPGHALVTEPLPR